MQKKYVLYGAGWEAEQFYYQFKERDKIDFVIDANKKGTFHGLNIYHFEDIPLTLENHTIIIATEIMPYFSIKKLLEQKGYHDYTWSKVNYSQDGRKVVIIHANCHGEVYKSFLMSNAWFNERYRIVDTLFIQDYAKSDDYRGGIPTELLEECDVYIHQDIRADNKISYYVSDDYVLPRLKKDCISITVPNLVGFGRFLYPTLSGVFKAINILGVDCYLFREDTFIDSLFLQYHNLDVIVEHLLTDSPLPYSEVNELFTERMERLKKREENWDIKISDFIIENYKEEKLFYHNNHPTPFLMNEICKRLGRFLGLEGEAKAEADLQRNESFVWPFVKRALDLHWSEEYVRKNNFVYWDKFAGGSLNLKEYVRQYVWWRFEEIL